MGTSATHHGERTMTSASDPATSSARATSMVAAASKTPSPVVAFAWGSRSTTSTRSSAADIAAASPSVTVVLPTPPFWLTIAVTAIAAR